MVVQICDAYAVFVFISMAALFIFLLVHTSSYTGSTCELCLHGSLDLLEMQQRTEATNIPREKDTTKVTETDAPTAVPMDASTNVLMDPTAAVHVL